MDLPHEKALTEKFQSKAKDKELDWFPSIAKEVDIKCEVKFSVVDENESTSSALHGNFFLWEPTCGRCSMGYAGYPIPCALYEGERVLPIPRTEGSRSLAWSIYSHLKQIHDLIHWKWNSSLIEWFCQMIRLQLFSFVDVVMNILFRWYWNFIYFFTSS